MPLTVGSRLGPYEVVAKLGEGGMGEVYKARDPRLDRLVAIKLLPSEFKDDPERRERFEREARAIAALNHPNIVTIYSVEQADDVLFLTMELVEGEALDRVIPSSGLPPEQLLRIAIPVVDAIATAHQKGITHRDLKPANIMVSGGDLSRRSLGEGGRVKVLDFGLAKLAGSPGPSDSVTALPTALATGEGRIVGTVAYMSPEQAEGKTVDARTDLFSLGVILYEMATGQRPFAGDTSISIISAIVKDTPKSISDLNPALPRDLSRIVKRALAKDPERRYQTAKDLRNDLEELKSSLDSGDLAAPVPATAPVVRDRRSRAWQMAAVGTGLIAVAAIGFPLWRARSPAAPPASSSIQLTALTSTGNADFGAISPDGKYVAYVQTIQNEQSIWVHQIASRSTVRIVPPIPGVRFAGLTITPDGSFVDFVRMQAAQFELWRVPFLGGPARKILDRATSSPGWSPDGKRMAFVVNVPPVNAERQLIVANPDGTNQRVIATRKLPQRFLTLTLSFRPDVRPLWSADGQSIVVRAVDERTPGRMELVQVDVATGAETLLHQFQGPGAGFRAGLAFAPDGRAVIATMSEEPAAPSQVVRVDLTSGTVTKLTNDLAAYGGITTAGSTVVTTRYEATSSLWIADAAGRGERQIGRDVPSPIRGLAWAGATHLIYPATLAEGTGLWSADTTSGASQLIVPGADMPSTSADGKLLVFAKDGREIWKSKSDGTNAVRIGDVLGGFPRISPDGSRVFYVSAASGVLTAWVVDLAGGAPRQFASLQANGFGMTSPDGSMVLLRSGAIDQPGTYIMKRDGGEPVRRLPMIPARGSIIWTPDGHGLSYVDESGSNIWVQPIDGGAPRQLTAFTKPDISEFAWSPDGKQLAFIRSAATSDIILLKNVQ